MPDAKPTADLLECFSNPNPGRSYFIEHTAEEFTSVCPKTGHPDFGTVILRYVPDLLCVELKSLKIYYQAYRNEGIFYEAVTNQIAEHLAAAMSPKWMMVETQWTGRGGIHSTIRVEYGRPPGTEDEDDYDDYDEGPLQRPGEENDGGIDRPPGF